MMKNFEIEISWVKAHGFRYVVKDGKLYWQTAIQTAEMDKDGHIVWHEKEYFDLL